MSTNPQPPRVRERAATTAAFTIVPRHVLGGQGTVAPSNKITLGYIGTGTEGLREMLPLLTLPEIQIVSVCDPSKEAVGTGLVETSLRDSIRRAIGNPAGAPARA
jgi:hypothetical protein